MADLDPSIILAGTATTHPVAPESLSSQLDSAARTGLLRAQTADTQQVVQGHALENQINAMNLRNAQGYGQAQMSVINGLRQQQAQMSQAVSANTAQGGVIDPSAPPAPAGVNPVAWDYAQRNGYSIDKGSDWYLDKDGTPVSHASGPLFSPSGRPNLFSTAITEQIADRAQQYGVSPQFIANLYSQSVASSSKFDSEYVTMKKNQNESIEASARAKELSSQTANHMIQTNNNMADDALNSPHPEAQAALLTAQMPRVWAPRLTAANVSWLASDGKPLQVQIDPKTQQPVVNGQVSDWSTLASSATPDINNPNFKAVFENAASSSTNAQDRANKASLESNRFHVVNGTDADGNPTASIVSVDASGKPVVNSTGITPPGMLTPDQVTARAKLIASYQTPPVTAATPNATKIMDAVKQFNPDYDATKYSTKAAARTAFLVGKQGQQVTSIETALNHIDAYKQAYAAINNNQSPIANRILNSIGVNFGGNGAITSADLASIIAGDETVKAVVGGQSGEHEREHLIQLLSARGSSPDMVNQNTDRLTELLGGRVGPLLLGAKKAGLTPNDLAISPRTQALPSVAPYVTGDGPQAPPPKTGATATGVPKPALGTIRGNYVYIGGDPGQQTSWKQK